MRDDLEQRAKELALYMIENRTTVRAAAKKVKAILDENRSQRHIRGGMATRRKYKGI